MVHFLEFQCHGVRIAESHLRGNFVADGKGLLSRSAGKVDEK